MQRAEAEHRRLQSKIQCHSTTCFDSTDFVLSPNWPSAKGSALLFLQVLGRVCKSSHRISARRAAFDLPGYHQAVCPRGGGGSCTEPVELQARRVRTCDLPSYRGFIRDRFVSKPGHPIVAVSPDTLPGGDWIHCMPIVQCPYRGTHEIAGQLAICTLHYPPLTCHLLEHVARRLAACRWLIMTLCPSTRRALSCDVLAIRPML